MMSIRSLRLGYLVPEFPGQTHSFFWREIVELRKRDIEVYIISTRLPPKPVRHEWVADATADYLTPFSAASLWRSLAILAPRAVTLLSDASTRHVLRRPKNAALAVAAARLVDFCNSNQIDHLHVHSCANAALLAALCRRLGGPTYSLTLHGSLSGYGGDQKYKWENASSVFAVSEALREEVSKVLPDQGSRIRIAPMGVDTEIFRPLSQKRSSPSKFTWFVCARLNPGKGFDALLAAVAKLRPDHEFCVRVAGEDDQGGTGYRRNLEEAIRRQDLQEHVVLLGAVPQQRVLHELQDANGFVLPSNDEALGVAYMEAMACQLPVIGSSVGGVPELIEDDISGILIPPRDSDQLASAMARVMGSSELRLRLGRAARERIVGNFGPDRSARALAIAAGEGKVREVSDNGAGVVSSLPMA
jgi:colanic acid/amylovoran biosynthesis glycosyltransferase